MLDTIAFDILNLNENLPLLDWLENQSFNTKVQSWKIEELNIEMKPELMPEAGLMFRKTRFLTFDGGRKHKEYSNHVVKSSHYTLSYFVDYDNDCIKFNFSIPKYLFGTNIAQFLPTTGQNAYGTPTQEFDDIQRMLGLTYRKLISFMKHFLNTAFMPVEVDPRHVQLKRLDFCFNQFFNNKQDALDYLKDVKNVNRKYARENGNGELKETSYESSFTHKSSGYFFKIYHKGTEYKANDSKKHKDFNNRFRKDNPDAPKTYRLFDIPFLQDTADKILRYEITFHNEYLNYCFKNKLVNKQRQFRNHNPNFWKIFDQAKADTNKCNKVDSKGKPYQLLVNKINDKGETYQVLLPYALTLTPLRKKAKNHYSKINGHQFKFMLAMDDTETTYFKGGDDASFFDALPRFAPFTERLFNALANEFLNNLKQYRLREKKEWHNLLSKIKEDNTTIKNLREYTSTDSKVKNLGNTEYWLTIFNLYNWNTSKMIAVGHSKATIYRWRSYFEKNHQLNKQNIGSNNTVNSANFNFTDHYTFFQAFMFKCPNLFFNR